MKHILRFDDYINESLGSESFEPKIGLSDQEFKEVCELVSEEIANDLDNPNITKDDVFYDIFRGDKKISVAVYDKKTNQLVGGLISKKRSIYETIKDYGDDYDVDWYMDKNLLKGKEGVEGLALAVKSEYKGSLASFVILGELIKNTKADYIIVQQYESLASNINYIKKGLSLICRIMSKEDDVYESINVYYGEISKIKSRFRI